MNSTHILFDDSRRNHLLPLTFTRPVAEIRVGILTIREKWEKMLGQTCGYLTAEYLSEKYAFDPSDNQYTLINGGVLPGVKLLEAINKLTPGAALISKETVIACKTLTKPQAGYVPEPSHFPNRAEYPNRYNEIVHPWHIFTLNGEAIEADFDLLTKGRKSEPISPTNTVLNAGRIFIEEGATVECSVLNANPGPIYIGSHAEVMEGSLVRGPFALCEHSALKLGAKIYGPTTVGPFSKVGGEVNNSVIQGYSNKAHDGFLGNSVIGEWCNLGADSNCSNLKNNYAQVKLWSYVKKGFVDTGLQFCGLIMGDHSKCGINTMFNTGTVVGVSANIFGDGFPRNFIPSFSWGGAQGFTDYKIDKALETAQKVMERRGIALSATEAAILTHIYNETAAFRR